MKRDRILITGANGQIGTVLTQALRQRYGKEQVLATDIRRPDHKNDPFEIVDALQPEQLQRAVESYKVGQVYHLAAILSAKGEQMPRKAWQVNMESLFNVLDLARDHQLRVFFPSSIAVFGAASPRQQTPQHTVLEPETVYGISKVAGESWAKYYHAKYGLDVRSLRYPGIIGYQSEPGGGTTDYAIEIFHSALENGAYECFLDCDTRLPMMYMADAIRATIELMEAPAERIRLRTSYNLSAMSFTPAELAEAIKQYIPEFKMTYNPDYRQEIASKWSESIDDQHARTDWGWRPEYDLQGMTKDMLEHLRERYGVANLS